MSNRSQLSAIRRKYCGDWLFYRSGEILGLLNPKFVSDERFLVELPLQPSRENIHGEILKDSKSVLVYLELEKELFVKFYLSAISLGYNHKSSFLLILEVFEHTPE